MCVKETAGYVSSYSKNEWVKDNLIPYMTLKNPNRRHSTYYLKHLVECHSGQYLSQEDLQTILADYGFPASNYYPVREEFFRRYKL